MQVFDRAYVEAHLTPEKCLAVMEDTIRQERAGGSSSRRVRSRVSPLLLTRRAISDKRFRPRCRRRLL